MREKLCCFCLAVLDHLFSSGWLNIVGSDSRFGVSNRKQKATNGKTHLSDRDFITNTLKDLKRI